MKEWKHLVRHTFPALFFAAALYGFYLKYVPLVFSFQALLLPVLIAVALLTACNPRRGTLLFVVLFPLINNWPYFFNLQPSIPYAPTALVLFLFYFFGWVVHRIFVRAESPGRSPLASPIMMAVGIVVLSAVITSWRFMNFYPFRSDGLYELVTNVNDVTAGGALMSVLFSSLNYITGFCFFLLLRNILKSETDHKALLAALGIGLLAAVLFGFFQVIFNRELGNTAFWVNLRQVNATFKDPNAFGVALAMVVPVFLGAAIALRGGLRLLCGSVFFLGFLILPFIGARSTLLGLILALIWLTVFLFRRRTKALLAVGALALSLAAVIGAAGLFHGRLFERLSFNFKNVTAKGGFVNLSPERYFLWKEATEMTADYPFSGVGVGAYIIELPNYYTKDKETYPPSFAAYRRNDSAENYFLQVGAELGLAGLAIFCWLFFVLGREIRRGFRNLGRESAASERRLLFIGGTAGIVAYFVNIFFHSYIGSFETNYLFWLLAAVTLQAGKRLPAEAGREGERRIPNWKIVAAATIFLVFGGTHLWNATHSLSPAVKTSELRLSQTFGLYAPEKTNDGQSYRWTREYGGLPVKAEGSAIRVPVLASHPDIHENPVKAEFIIVKDLFKEKIRLGTITLKESVWRTYEFSLPGAALGEGILLVKVSRTWNPLKVTGVPDPRNLGVAVGKVTFRDK